MHGKCCIYAALDTHLAILAEHVTNNLFEIQQDVAIKQFASQFVNHSTNWP